MLSGRRLDLLDPSPLDIEIEDIAHGLARVARWNGQTVGEHPFSVAQHSIVVVAITNELYPQIGAAGRLAALLHDAAEYVIGDMISPFKAVIGDEYVSVEHRLASAIRRRFGLPAELSPSLVSAIKDADRVAAFHEATRLAGFEHGEARRIFGQPRIGADRLELEPWPTAIAEERFRSQFGVFAAAVSAEPG
jgi:5'-deoxynucleotidase YfbR-like HD superfamily hydrolase